jgi:uncharacterized protein YdeI (YjbR/CyaY-like superfamily)
MSATNPKVDAFLAEDGLKWREESRELRKICLGCGLTEELKWAKPCYTFRDSNVVIIQGFKDYCALMFCKGALLKDPKGVLSRIGEHTQAARQYRFTSVRELDKMKPALKAFIREAVEAEKAGLKVEYKKTPEPIPEELARKFRDSPSVKVAFEALTPGRQRAYIYYFNAAKQSKTREARIEKCMPRIFKGRGLLD